MTDLVGTCPKSFWREWLAEGDAAGEPESGEEWGWYTGHSYVRLIKPGDRFYVVAHGRLRGYAPVTRVGDGVICRRGGAVACTLPGPIAGFRGLRVRWWDRADEVPFPDWKTAGVEPETERVKKARTEADLLETPSFMRLQAPVPRGKQ